MNNPFPFPLGTPEGCLTCETCSHAIEHGEVFVSSIEGAGWMCRGCLHQAEGRRFARGLGIAFACVLGPVTLAAIYGTGLGLVAAAVAIAILWVTPSRRARPAFGVEEMDAVEFEAEQSAVREDADRE